MDALFDRIERKLDVALRMLAVQITLLVLILGAQIALLVA